MSRSNNFPSVSRYQHSENPKSHGTLFLLPYGNKCYVFFLVSLIALSAIQFSKYLPLSAESLLYGQVFPGTRGSVLSAANPRAYWGGSLRGGGKPSVAAGLAEQGSRPPPAPKQGLGAAAGLSPDSGSPGKSTVMRPGWDTTSTQSPSSQTSRSGAALSAFMSSAQSYSYLEAFEIIESNNPCLIDEL